MSDFLKTGISDLTRRELFLGEMASFCSPNVAAVEEIRITFGDLYSIEAAKGPKNSPKIKQSDWSTRIDAGIRGPAAQSRK